MSSNYGFQPTLSGLNTIESDSTTSSNIICDTIQINQSGTAPTMTPNDNSTHIATTAYVDSAISGSGFVTLSGTQTISGQKTFTAANTYVTGNLVCNNFISDNSGIDINIGRNLFTGDIILGNPTGTAGQNTALNWGTTSNSGQLTFRGGSFTLSSTGNYTQQSGGALTTSIDTNKTTGAFNMLTGTTWSGNCNIGNGTGATGNINVGGATTKTYLSGNTFVSGNVYVSDYLVSSSTTTNNVRVDDGTTNHFMKFNAQNMTFEATQSVAFLANTGYLTFGSPANTYFTNSSGTGKIVQIQDTNFTPLSFEVGTGFNFIRSFAPFTLLTSGTNDAVYTAGGNVTIGGTNTFMPSPVVFNNTASFNVSLPTSSLTPSASNEFTTKAYVDSAISGSSIFGTNNTWTGRNTFQNFFVNQNAGTDISLNINDHNDSIRMGLTANGQLQFKYIQALNRVIIGQTVASKDFSLYNGGTEYLRCSPTHAGVLVNKLTTSVMDYQANNININTAGVDMTMSLNGTNYVTLQSSTSKVVLAPTRCASYLEVVGEIQANNPIEVTYNPSSISAGRIGYQVLYSYNTVPVVGGTNQIGGAAFNFPAVGVWLCELYAGWAQTSNNRAISISLNTLIDYTRAQFSTQQNSSYQQLNLTTVISVTSTATNYYLLQQCGSNAGSFGGTSQQYFRITRIA